MACQKWKDKIEMLGELEKVLENKEVEQEFFGDIVNMAKVLFLDNNVLVVAHALKIVQAVCGQQKRLFHSTAKQIFGQILQKMKEKKSQVVDEAKACLQCFFDHCLELEDVVDEIKEGLNNKVISARVNTIGIIDYYY